MFQAKLLVRFLGDCIATTTFVINITPSFVLKCKSPFEFLYDKLPTYSEFSVFGCLCYISTVPQQRNKFTPKDIPRVFLGYPAGYKSYKAYDLVSNTFHISRDTIFHEDTFPFHAIYDNNTRDVPFHNVVIPNPVCVNSPYDHEDNIPNYIDEGT